MCRARRLAVACVVLAAGVTLAAGCAPRGASAPAAAAPDTLVHAAGLSAPVHIVTDPHGIPHIAAATLDDLYFAWGYVTARERLWQIAHNRAAARGDRWRWMGNDVLRADGAAELLQFQDYAERLWAREQGDPRVGPALRRYTDGINAWIERCERGAAPWPAEFRALGVTPLRWRPEDSCLLLWSLGVLLDLDLSELGERAMVDTLGKDGVFDQRRFESDVRYTTIPDSAAARLWGDAAAAARVAAAPGATRRVARAALSPILEPLRAAFGRRDPEARASNVFAIGPGRSASGAPLLANDMHLGLTVPAPVMMIHVTVPGVVDAAGAFPPGLPTIVSGRNRDCAWGITALSADMLDVYADTISADGKSVRGPDGTWTKVRVEPFAMRFRVLGVPLPPWGQSRRYGPHGPILLWDRKARLAYGVRWSALSDDVSLARLMGIERSASAAELEARWMTLVTPGINVIVADRAGDVRYRALGAIPRRTRDPGRGPVAGDGRGEWDGVVAPEAMPAWAPPRDGFAVNANNLPIGDAYPVPLPRFDWSHDRALRIDAQLAAGSQHSASDLIALQGDLHSLRAARFLPLMLAAADSAPPGRSPLARAALDTLRGWDLEAAAGRVAPTLFWSWYGSLERRADLAGLPGRLHAALEGRAESPWRDPLTGTPEARGRAVSAALDTAVAALARRLGGDPARWTYGPAHRASFEHPLDSRATIAPLMPDSIALDGDGGTVSVGRSRLPWRTDVVHAPVFRHVVDLADTNRSWVMITPGNSGNLEGPHARDLLQRWAARRPVELRMRWAELDTLAGTRATRLVPTP
jgi:penicillin amidase